MDGEGKQKRKSRPSRCYSLTHFIKLLNVKYLSTAENDACALISSIKRVTDI